MQLHLSSSINDSCHIIAATETIVASMQDNCRAKLKHKYTNAATTWEKDTAMAMPHSVVINLLKAPQSPLFPNAEARDEHCPRVAPAAPQQHERT